MSQRQFPHRPPSQFSSALTAAGLPECRDTGAELILIILLAGGIIYATFASNPMSFDDLIELRFLPSRRRH